MNYSRKNINQKITDVTGQELRQKNRFFLFLLTLLVAVFITAIMVCGSMAVGAFMEIISNRPSLESLDQISPDANKSIVYASDGSVMQELIESGSNRISISFSDMPRDMVNAFVAIEDARFFTHDGVDVKGIFRAVFVGFTSGSLSEGASTITQQLIKNNIFNGGLETNMGDRIERKLQEQYLALSVEKNLSKETIVEYYLNTLNLGSGCLGVEVASNRYFGKHARDLDLSECTVLAAITSNPSKYNPITHPENNQKRRKIVLQNMLDEGLITENEYQIALSEDVYKRIQQYSETYTSDARKTFSYFTDAVFEDVVQSLQDRMNYSESEASSLMYSGGLRIYTTMDPEIQAIVDREVNDPENYIRVLPDGTVSHFEAYELSYRLTIELSSGKQFYYDETNLKKYYQDQLGELKFSLTFNSEEELQKAVDTFRNYILKKTGGEVVTETVTSTLEPQTSAVVMDQHTGEVLALSGGRGEKKGSLVLNRATMSTRQPGSCFKIVSTYAPALDISGSTLASTFYDAPLQIENRSISNWWGTDYLGYANIREGIIASMNVVAVRCLEDVVSESTAYAYLRSFGFTTLVEDDKSPVMTLGGLTYGVTNLELTTAYASIANDGQYHSPVFWTRVTDAEGNIIMENEPTERTVVKKTTAELLTSAMEDVIDPDEVLWPQTGVSATAAICKLSNMHAAGKSGTTTDANDIWFVGYTPYTTLGIWSGYDSSVSFGSSPGYHELIWQKIMQQIVDVKGQEDRPFSTDNLETAKICSKSGLLAREGVCDCSDDPSCHVYEEYFAPGTAPTEYCTRHTAYSICSASGQLANEFCPREQVVQKVYITIDPQDAELGDTIDSAYTIPEGLRNSVCTLHGAPVPEEESEAEPEFSGSTPDEEENTPPSEE